MEPTWLNKLEKYVILVLVSQVFVQIPSYFENQAHILSYLSFLFNYLSNTQIVLVVISVIKCLQKGYQVVRMIVEVLSKEDQGLLKSDLMSVLRIVKGIHVSLRIVGFSWPVPHRNHPDLLLPSQPQDDQQSVLPHPSAQVYQAHHQQLLLPPSHAMDLVLHHESPR